MSADPKHLGKKLDINKRSMLKWENSVRNINLKLPVSLSMKLNEQTKIIEVHVITSFTLMLAAAENGICTKCRLPIFIRVKLTPIFLRIA